MTYNVTSEALCGLQGTQWQKYPQIYPQRALDGHQPLCIQPVPTPPKGLGAGAGSYGATTHNFYF